MEALTIDNALDNQTNAGADMTTADVAELLRYEAVIKRGLQTFVEVGNALAAIRDARLYRGTHDTFEEYCRDRWGIQRAHAYRLIDGAEVVKNLSPTGDILPTNERQVRPLTKLEPEQQREVWAEAVEDAGGHAPTAAQVEKAAVQFAKPDSVPARAEIKPLRDAHKPTVPVIAEVHYQKSPKSELEPVKSQIDDEEIEAMVEVVLESEEEEAERYAIEGETPPNSRLARVIALRDILTHAEKLSEEDSDLITVTLGIVGVLSKLKKFINKFEGEKSGQ